jgi:hypothetical protein
MYGLKSEIKLLLEMKWGPFPQFCDYKWMFIFASCADINEHMNELHINLQKAKHIVTDVFNKITA